MNLNMEIAISIENLSKVFYNKKGKKVPLDQKEIWALNGISFEVERGEIFGLLGPNGAGKTTTIRCIAGLLKPASGTIFINQQKLTESYAHLLRKKLGFLTENHGNYENLSVYDNLSFFGSFYNLKDIDDRIKIVLKQMGLLERENMKAGKLSKGQKQRLSIARAILHDPEIIFFDEPTAGLDPAAAVKVRNLILNLKREDRTIFLNSHNLEEVQKICDRVAILDQGRIKRIGTPADISRDLWDTQELVCTLKNPVSSEIREVINNLKFIKSYRIDNNKIFIYVDDVNEASPLIIKEFVRVGAEILEISRTIHSLEDIYLRLMENNNSKERQEEFKIGNQE